MPGCFFVSLEIKRSFLAMEKENDYGPRVKFLFSLLFTQTLFDFPYMAERPVSLRKVVTRKCILFHVLNIKRLKIKNLELVKGCAIQRSMLFLKVLLTRVEYSKKINFLEVVDKCQFWEKKIFDTDCQSSYLIFVNSFTQAKFFNPKFFTQKLQKHLKIRTK